MPSTKKPINLVAAVFLCLAAPAMWLGSAASPASSRVLHTVDPGTPQGLQELFRPTGDPLPLLSAHRGGAAQDFPENCLATFEHTLRYAWSMLEIDLNYTKDGQLVLCHDSTLNRTTNGTGRIQDFTLSELRRLRLKDRRGNLTDYQMPTLDETIEWARGKTILVLDKKEVPIRDAVRKIVEHRAESYVLVMAYSRKDITECHALNRNIMMEVMVGTNERFGEFEQTGVPWSNIIAFVGHTPTPAAELCRRIRAKGASCMAGSSRNIDRRFLDGKVADMAVLLPDYQALLGGGVDVIETDIPREVGPILYGGKPVTGAKAKFFRGGQP